MTSQFVALPVSKGDAFYLRRKQGSVLFDGGQFNNLYDLMKANGAINTKKIDIIICSHNDADHAKGLISLLEVDENVLSISEVWLPSRWAEVIHRIATDQFFMYKVCRDINSLTEFESLEELHEHTSPSSTAPLESTFNSEVLYKYTDQLQWFTICACKTSAPHLLLNTPRKKNSKIRKQARLAAIRIAKIAVAAINRKCVIRWFDFQEFQNLRQCNGGENWLSPLNSVEATTHKITKYSNLGLLALSVANKESLTFYSNVDDEPSVVFSADSDFRNVTLPKLSNPLVTAPHHGSPDNKSVYGLFQMPSSWVRSDMKTPARPCQEYTQLQNKYCTQCKNQTHKQTLTFHSCGGNWLPQNTNSCKC